MVKTGSNMKQKEDDSRGYNENDTGYGLSPEEIAKLETMTEAERIEKPTEEIPQWIIDYNNAGYTSGAGKAIKFLMNRLSDMEFERVSHKAENERLQQLIKEKDEQLDYLHLKLGFSENTNKKFSEAYNENSRLQQLIKEKDDLIQKINNHVCAFNDDQEKVDYIKSLINKAK